MNTSLYSCRPFSSSSLLLLSSRRLLSSSYSSAVIRQSELRSRRRSGDQEFRSSGVLHVPERL